MLDFQKTGTAAAGNSDLAHRYLRGNSVDQLLADETAEDGSEEDVAWALTDHLNSVRDLVAYDPITGTVSVVKHVTSDAFGNVTSDNAPTVLTLFRYTARPFDSDAGIQNNGFRWLDLSTGRWMSVDPIGFAARDANLYRYVGNSATSQQDPTGLAQTLAKAFKHIEYRPMYEDAAVDVQSEMSFGGMISWRHRRHVHELWTSVQYYVVYARLDSMGRPEILGAVAGEPQVSMFGRQIDIHEMQNSSYQNDWHDNPFMSDQNLRLTHLTRRWSTLSSYYEALRVPYYRDGVTYALEIQSKGTMEAFDVAFPTGSGSVSAGLEIGPISVGVSTGEVRQPSTFPPVHPMINFSVQYKYQAVCDGNGGVDIVQHSMYSHLPAYFGRNRQVQ